MTAKTLILDLPILRVHRLILKRRFNLKLFWILSFILVITLFSLCVFQVIKTTAESYLITGYEREITKISQENKDLKILLSQQNSLGDLEKMAGELNFEPVTKIHYIKVLGGEVVTK